MEPRAHIIRLYPTQDQEKQLKNTIGCARYAYNWALEKWREMYAAHDKDKASPKPSALKLTKLWTQEKPGWAHETAYCSQQRAIHNVGVAYQRLRRGLSAKPKFHKKGGKETFYVDNAKVAWYGNRIQLPDIGRVRVAEQIRFEGKVMGYTVSHYAGQWHLIAQVNAEGDVKPYCANPESVVGIDVGLLNPAVASDGTKLELPTEKLQKLDAKLRRQQKALSRSQRNSRNHAKLLIKKQRTQNKINNIRKDAVHKFTTAIAKSHGTAVIEDLDIKEMKDKAPARSVRRAYNSSLMGAIRWQLSYKVQHLIKVNRFFPSSKTCSNCGHIKGDLTVGERTYRCDNCGAVIDRDLNAAINLMKSGLVKPEASVEQVGTDLR